VTITTVALSSGVATFTASTASIAAGKYPVVAKYSGDANDKASTSPAITITVTSALAATTTTLAAKPQTVSSGGTVTLTATVTRQSATGTPGGTVNFYIGSQLLGSSTLSAGSASFSIATAGVPLGAYSVTADYLGDSADQPSTSAPVTVTITIAPTTTTLTAMPTTVTEGGAVTLKATVAKTSGTGTPAGTVTFYYGNTVLETANLSNGVAQISATTSGVPPGTYAITAKYSGDANDASSTSNHVSVTVTAD
jgi:hypothetical protein